VHPSKGEEEENEPGVDRWGWNNINPGVCVAILESNGISAKRVLEMR
jgi:hypothetical protein